MEKFITINDANYFGTLNSETRTFVGIATDGMEGKSLFGSYLKKKAVSGLVTVNIGEGRDLISAEMTDEEIIIFDMVKAQWAVAEKRSQGWLVGKVFESGLGKI